MSMERKRRPVKHARTYDSSGRAAQAARNRTAVLESAERLLLNGGYASTTITAIAAAAGVSVETIYKTFGGKAGLVRAIRDWRLAGIGTVAAESRSNQARAEVDDPYELIARWGGFTAEIAPLVSPILLLIRSAAATDPEAAALLTELDADRHRRMRVNARHLRNRQFLRPGVSVAEAVDVLWTFSSAELYELLVVRRGWSPARYGHFVAEAMTAALLPPRHGPS